MIHLIGLFCSCTVTGYVFFEVMRSLYEKKYIDNKPIYALAIIGYIILSTAVALLKVPLLNLVYSVSILCVLSVCLFKTDKKNVFINSGIVIIYLAIVDMIVTTVFSTFLKSNTFDTLQDPKYYLLSSLGNVIVILCTNKLMIQALKHCQISKASIILHIYMIFLMMFEFWILSYFMELDLVHNIPLLLMSLGFVLVDAGILYLYWTISINALIEKRAELVEHQLDMTVKYYEDFQGNYERIEKILHDTKKHLEVLEGLNNINNEIGKEYAKEVLESLNNIQQQFRCDDKIVSAIIWNKIQVCEQQNIKLEINIPENIYFGFMNRMEITALFANLLDNAIEACQSIKTEKKMIVLRIHCFKEHVIIKLKNSMGTLPKFKEGKLISTKESHLGIGMLILENLANKYCGSMNYEYSEDFFETNIILFVKNER